MVFMIEPTPEWEEKLSCFFALIGGNQRKSPKLSLEGLELDRLIFINLP